MYSRKDFEIGDKITHNMNWHLNGGTVKTREESESQWIVVRRNKNSVTVGRTTSGGVGTVPYENITSHEKA